jgi:hypothetical protein
VFEEKEFTARGGGERERQADRHTVREGAIGKNEDQLRSSPVLMHMCVCNSEETKRTKRAAVRICFSSFRSDCR